MKVVFLGSGHGVPEPNRNCSCALLEVNKKKYLIDIGIDPTHDLVKRGLTPDDIAAVFITHTHGDHLNGLVAFTDICSWFYKTADPLIFIPDLKPLDALKAWVKCTCGGLRGSIRFQKVTEGSLFDDGVVHVKAMRTHHVQNSFAYMIEAENKKILFTGDLKGGDGPLIDYTQIAAEDGIDLVIAEGAHFDPMLYLEPLRKHPPKKLCINHYNWRHIEDCYHLKNLIQGEISTLLASDGLEISV